jgi:hypothetical protein
VVSSSTVTGIVPGGWVSWIVEPPPPQPLSIAAANTVTNRKRITLTRCPFTSLVIRPHYIEGESRGKKKPGY